MQMQQLNLGVQILEESSVFTEGLKAWYQRPQNQHTWESFKTHFLNELKELKSS